MGTTCLEDDVSNTPGNLISSVINSVANTVRDSGRGGLRWDISHDTVSLYDSRRELLDAKPTGYARAWF